MKNEVARFALRDACVGDCCARVAILYVVVISGIPSAQAETYQLLFQFRAGVDGSAPWAGLVSDSSGNFYGTTSADGAFDSGVVFRLSPAGKETVLHGFSGSGGDGEFPLAGLVRDAAGNLYGTTSDGGIYGGVCGGFGCGTVFKVDKTGKETALYSFTGDPDGSNPYAGLVRDAAGNLYGTTRWGVRVRSRVQGGQERQGDRVIQLCWGDGWLDSVHRRLSA
jgi:uncharacterized repeat protein (TIGR03803 family)